MLLRQIATCTALATTVIERRTPTALQYRLGVCRRHRWLATDWKGHRIQVPGGTGRCGTVIDYRSFIRVVQSHIDLWLGSTTTQYLDMHGGSVARTLRAAADFQAQAAADWVRNAWPIESALATALDHTATIAESIDTETLDTASGQHQLLAALGTAETLAAAARGA